MYQLDLHSRAPIYQQLKDQILRLIMAGAIGPGDPLPSVRVMARELGINPNTVAKAYQDLEKSGLIYSVAGKGSFISGSDQLGRQVTVSITDKLRKILIELKNAGVALETVLQLTEQVYGGGYIDDKHSEPDKEI